MQKIRFLTTRDGVQLAWATEGSGPPLVKASNWLTHLEHDWNSPVWRHWVEFMTSNFDSLRYDERGCGMSDWNPPDIDTRHYLEDLEDVVAAAKPARPFTLLGISQGAAAAVSYAVRHPEDVSHLIIYGGYARGWKHRNDLEEIRRRKAIIELIELGWGKTNPVFRQLFTSGFIPDASDEQVDWFNDLCRKTTTPKMAARMIDTRGGMDVTELLPQVQVPTLVIHARNEISIPYEEGRFLATNIPDAEFVELDSRNHILLADEPAWERFKEVVLEFTGVRSSDEAELFRNLSTREREILAKMTEGRTNAEIGSALFISEKTVRNHVTKIFEKLGVNSRAQAIVLARDNGFRGST